MVEYSDHKCACGCGGKIEKKPWHKYNGIPKYIKGHHLFAINQKGRFYKKFDKIGKVYGRLTVIERRPKRNGSYYWLCLCECGNYKEIRDSSLQNTHSQSCGCLSTGFIKHGCGGGKVRKMTLAYRSWIHLRSRCKNPKNPTYKYYGGKGIDVCEKWNVFVNFLEDMGEREIDECIHRLDGEGDYEPENCEWKDKSEHARDHAIEQWNKEKSWQFV